MSDRVTLTKTHTPQLTPLLDNDLVARLGRLRLQPTRRQTNRNRGEHLSGQGGTSTEFSDYRDYVAGDDTRFVDWNIFSRLNRPYIKLFRLEQEMHVLILVDGSQSMHFENKLLRAKQLAAAFGVMGLMALERVSIFEYGALGQAPRVLPPCTGRVSMKRLFHFLETEQPGGNYPLEAMVDQMLSRHQGRGIAVLLSDFLTPGEHEKTFNKLFSAGLGTFAVQILGPGELEPELDGDLRLVDSETGAILDVTSANDLLSIYTEQRNALQARLTAATQQRRGRFTSINSETPLRSVLLDNLLRGGWMR